MYNEIGLYLPTFPSSSSSPNFVCVCNDWLSLISTAHVYMSVEPYIGAGEKCQ